jgi:predicted RNA binding protein YcfA (HicA-like mRNA interferase family)
MSRLPVCSGAQAIRAFERVGWKRDRQKGDHVMLFKAGSFFVLTVPLHKEIAKGTLRRLIRDAGLTVDEFTKIL